MTLMRDMPADLRKLRQAHTAMWEALDVLTGDDLWDDLPQEVKDWYHRWTDRYVDLVAAEEPPTERPPWADELARRFAGVVHNQDDGAWAADVVARFFDEMTLDERMEAMGMQKIEITRMFLDAPVKTTHVYVEV